MDDNKDMEIPYITNWTSVGDAQKIWRRYGWRPPTEYRMDYLFAKNREDFEIQPENHHDN